MKRSALQAPTSSKRQAAAVRSRRRREGRGRLASSSCRATSSSSSREAPSAEPASASLSASEVAATTPEPIDLDVQVEELGARWAEDRRRHSGAEADPDDRGAGREACDERLSPRSGDLDHVAAQHVGDLGAAVGNGPMLVRGSVGCDLLNPHTRDLAGDVRRREPLAIALDRFHLDHLRIGATVALARLVAP